MSDNYNSGSSFGLATLLTVLFVGLKLTHYISWSWWWVFSPLWISAAFVAFIALVVLLIAVAFALTGH